MEITGSIIRKSLTQKVSESFSKREFVIETKEQYPQQIQIECHKEKCGLLDGLKSGDVITAHINLRGRAWKNPQGEERFFNTLVAWKIDKDVQAQPSAPNYPPTPNAQEASKKFLAGDEDDLPF